MCVICPVTGFLGGTLGAYFGIMPPKTMQGRVFSALATASLVVVTTVALKSLFGISICDGTGKFILKNIVQVAAITAFMGVIYSLVVNSLLNYCLAPSKCCCKKGEVVV